MAQLNFSDRSFNLMSRWRLALKSLTGLGVAVALSCVASGAWAGPGSDRLNPNEVLYPGQSLKSQNGFFILELQNDGNLVLYSRNLGFQRPLWSSRTSGQVANRLVMQSDGNLVLYSPSGRATWSSGTSGRENSFVVVQNDGNMVIYFPGDPIWTTRTKQ